MILVYGGSFDPPHLGHLNTVRALRDKFPTAFKILIYPNAISPFKTGKSLQAEEILALCKLTFQDLLGDQIEIRETEIFSNEPSYTIVTIRELRANFPEEEIRLCIGEDSLTHLTDWHQYEALFELLEGFVILRRKTKSPLPIQFPSVEMEQKSLVLDNELWDVSSTRLRQDREREYAKHWMMPAAFQYLQERHWFS